MNRNEQSVFFPAPLGQALAHLKQAYPRLAPPFFNGLQAFLQRSLWQGFELAERGSFNPVFPPVRRRGKGATLDETAGAHRPERTRGARSERRWPHPWPLPGSAEPVLSLNQPLITELKRLGSQSTREGQAPWPLKAQTSRLPRTRNRPEPQSTTGTLGFTALGPLLPRTLVHWSRQGSPQPARSPQVPKVQARPSAPGPRSRKINHQPVWEFLARPLRLTLGQPVAPFESGSVPTRHPARRNSKRPILGERVAQPMGFSRLHKTHTKTGPILASAPSPGINALRRLHRWIEAEKTPATAPEFRQRPLLRPQRLSRTTAPLPATEPQIQVIHHRPTQHLHLHGALSPQELAGFK